MWRNRTASVEVSILRARGWSVDAIASAVGVSSRTVYRWQAEHSEVRKSHYAILHELVLIDQPPHEDGDGHGVCRRKRSRRLDVVGISSHT